MHEAAVPLPAAQRLEGLRNPRGIIEPGETLHASTPSHQIGIVRRAGLRRGGVGFRDRAAQHDARVDVDPSEDLVEDLAADIVEEHVDPAGAKLRKPSAEVFALVVDGGVEVRLVDQPSAFSRAARGADNLAALDLGDLAGDGARGPGGARHHDGLTSLDLADLDHPEIRCQAVDSEQAQREVGRRVGSDLLHSAEAFAIGHEVVLPAEVASHEVARSEVRMARVDHLPDSKGLHDIAKRNRGLVGIARYPDALRGVDRQPKGPDQNLSIGGPWNRRLIPEKLFSGQFARGASVQNPLAVLAFGHRIFASSLSGECLMVRSLPGPPGAGAELLTLLLRMRPNDQLSHCRNNFLLGSGAGTTLATLDPR